MFTLLMYAICLIAFLEGLRALQLAIAWAEPTKNWRKWLLALGVLGFTAGTIGAAVLAYQFTMKGWELQQGLDQWANPPAAAPPPSPRSF